MRDFSATHPPRSPALRGSAARLVEPSLRLLAALLLLTAMACGNDDLSNFGSTPAASNSNSNSGSGSSAAGTQKPMTYSMTFLPSPSGSVDGYEVAVGPSSGGYDTTLDIPLSAISTSGSIWTYDLTLEAGRDHYMVLRAYNASGMSANSNEIRIDAVTGSAANVPGGGEAGASLAAAVATSRTELAYTTLPGAESQQADGNRQTVAVAETAGDDAEQRAMRDPMSSLDFDGAGEHLASADPTALGASYTFSMTVWARPVVDSAARRTLVDLASEVGDANRMTVAVVNGSDVELTLYGADGELLHRSRFAGAMLDGEWQHVAVVFDGDADLEPRFYVDAQQQTALESFSAAGEWAMVDSVRRVFLGADASGASGSWLGQLGHAAFWNAPLSNEALQEIATLGHAADLRGPGSAYRDSDSLLHYWRLGDDAVGIDAGAEPVDLDGSGGGIDADDIVEEGPEMLELAAR